MSECAFEVVYLRFAGPGHVDGDDVKAAFHIIDLVDIEIAFGSPPEHCLLTWCDRIERVAVASAFPGFDFDKYKLAVVFGDQVYFAVAPEMKISLNDLESFFFEVSGSNTLSFAAFGTGVGAFVFDG